MDHPNEIRPMMNADRRRQFGQPGRMLALVCECVDPDCRNTVLISTEDYDAIRPGPVLDPDHAGPTTAGFEDARHLHGVREDPGGVPSLSSASPDGGTG